VEKSQYELCIEVLRRLHKVGVLENAMIIGSWCIPFYMEYSAKTNYTSSIKTRDIDFLIPVPAKFRCNTDIPNLLKDLGFIIGFKGPAGYIMLEHPSLIVEFLVPEKGKGLDKPYPLPQLGVNAQTVRFLNFLTQSKINIEVEGIPVIMPHPANFALHKLLILERRTTSDKLQKDVDAAKKILKALVEIGDSASIRGVFESAPKRWQKKMMRGLREIGEENLLGILR
jgi:hypothetical protein